MNNKRNRRIALVVAVLMLTMVFSSTGFAAWTGKTLNAQFRNVSIFVNNQYKQATTANGQVVEPFIVDGTTYVPLRGIAQMFGYEVGFNPATYRIDITGDVAGNNAAAQYEILILQARIAELEDELEEQESSSMDLGDLEDNLNDDYDAIEDVDVKDINLDGDEDDVEVEIVIDTTDKDQWDAWNDLSDSDIKGFLQDIIDDILDEYPDADITGFIWDEYDGGEELETFGIDTRGDVDLGGGSSSGNYDIDDIAELENVLDDEFATDSGFDFKIDVSNEDGDKIDLEVEIQDEELADLSSSDWDDIEDYLIEMCEFIEDEYNSDIIIIGDFVDEYGDYEYFDYDGSFEWYDL